MNREAVARELVRLAKELTARNQEAAMSSLLKKVLVQAGEKAALAIHSDLLKKSTKYTDDERLNPDAELWVPDFMPVMIDAAIKKLKSLK